MRPPDAIIANVSQVAHAKLSCDMPSRERIKKMKKKFADVNLQTTPAPLLSESFDLVKGVVVRVS